MMLNRLLDIGEWPPTSQGAWLFERIFEVCHTDSYNHTLVFPRSLRVYA